MKYFLSLLLLVIGSSVAYAQRNNLYASAFVGDGGNSLQGGVALGDYSLRRHGFIYPGGFVELGLFFQQTAGGVFSLNYDNAFALHKKDSRLDRKAVPFATIGYSRFSAPANGLNFGGGFEVHSRRDRDGCMHSIRLEYRQYWLPSQPRVQGLQVTFQHDLRPDECD